MFCVFVLVLFGVDTMFHFFQWPALYEFFGLLDQPNSFRVILFVLALVCTVVTILFEQLLINTGVLRAVWRGLKRRCCVRVPKRRNTLLRSLTPDDARV